MTPYFLLLGLPAFFSLFKGKQTAEKKASMFALDVFFLIFLAILSLRSMQVGADLKNYHYFFKQVQGIGFVDLFTFYLEPGYFVLAKITQIFTQNFQIFLALIAFLTVIPIWKMYRKESSNAYLTLILFATVAPFTVYFSGLRQILAVTLGIPAYYYTKQKKPLQFVLIVLLAYFFHQSALLLFFLYPLYHVKLTKNSFYFVAPAMLGVVFFGKEIFIFLLPFMGERYIQRYADITSTGAYTVLLLLFVFALYAFIIPDEKKMDAETLGLRNILLLCVVIQCFAPVNSMAMRMNYYFLIFVPLVIPKIAESAKPCYKKLSSMSVVVMNLVFTAWFLYNGYRGGDMLNVFPYIPFWR